MTESFWLVSPVSVPYFITQHFGARPEYYKQFGLPGHEGLDFRAPHGSPVYAAQRGTVVMVAVGKLYGQQILIAHGDYLDGIFATVYAHLQTDSPLVKKGDAVTAGQLIALADNTGNSSGDHLHFVLRRHGAKNGGYGNAIDPLPYLQRVPPPVSRPVGAVLHDDRKAERIDREVDW